MSEPENRIELLRRLRTTDQPIAYGQAPIVHVKKTPPKGIGIGIFLAVAIATLIGGIALNKSFSTSCERALIWGALAACIYWLSPIWIFLYGVIRYRGLPAKTLLDEFSLSQKWITCLTLSFGLTCVVDIALLKVFHWWHSTHPHFHYSAHPIFSDRGISGIFDFSQFLGVWLFFLIITGLGVILLFSRSRPTSENLKTKKGKKAEEAPERSEIAFTPSFKLWVGKVLAGSLRAPIRLVLRQTSRSA